MMVEVQRFKVEAKFFESEVYVRLSFILEIFRECMPIKGMRIIP